MINDRQRQDTRPLNVPRTKRNHNLTVLTSIQAGKMMPLAAIPLLREDAVQRGSFSATFELHETVEVLMNPVYMTVSAYFFPFLASERFEGSMDQFNRSYKGKPKIEGGDVEPFFEMEALPAGGATSCEIYKYLGMHGSEGDTVSTFYKEAYNEIWKYRAKNRSPDIELPDRLNDDLLPAFWPTSRFASIVPDFDQAKMEGAIPITFIDGKLPVRGLGGRDSLGINVPDNKVYLGFNGDVREWMGSNDVGRMIYSGPPLGSTRNVTDVGGLEVDIKDVFAELQEGGIALSLANIEVAKKTRAFARLRERFNQHSEDWVIDMLMGGLTIPDQAYKQPMLVAHQRTVFQMGKRFSTDADNLDAHVVNGAARVNMNFRVPRMPTGGVVMIVGELVPEQLFERQRDPIFHIGSVAELPDYIRDETDPEKVVEVKNDMIDTDHDDPNGLFGYAPLNYQYAINGPRIGGRFVRPDIDAAEDTDRQRLWAVETKNPKLAENFYIVSDIHTKPFLHPDEDPADCVLLGNVLIEGNTVFGGALIEASDDYETIAAQVPQNRIEKA